MATELLMPKLGLTMTEGTIDEWIVKEGDQVHKGDIIYSVATDKLTNDVEAEADGILLVDEKIRKRSGDVLPVLELRKPVRRRASAVGHRARSVEDDGRPQVRLVDILLDVEPLAARDELPVEIAEVVAGHIRTMFGELGAGAFARALVAAGDETVDGAVREELDSPELLQRRIRQPPHVSRQRHFRQPSPVRRQVPRGPARGRADA